METFEQLYQKHGTKYDDIDLDGNHGRAYITYAIARKGSFGCPPMTEVEATAETLKYHRGIS